MRHSLYEKETLLKGRCAKADTQPATNQHMMDRLSLQMLIRNLVACSMLTALSWSPVACVHVDPGPSPDRSSIPRSAAPAVGSPQIASSSLPEEPAAFTADPTVERSGDGAASRSLSNLPDVLQGVYPAPGLQPISESAKEAEESVLPPQEGVVSWYDECKRTAMGTSFDPEAMTAAHRTLPFGTKVKVTRLDVGKSVVVTINDRGPFIRGRIIDVARAPARALGLIERGIAPCRVEILNLPN